MKNNRIKTDKKPDISDEQILKHKNFDKLYQHYQTMHQPFYKTLKFWGGAGAAGILATVITLSVVYFSNNGNPKSPAERQPAMDTAQAAVPAKFKISPPFESLDIPYEEFCIPVNKEHTITTASGTILEIPEHAFVDEADIPVTGSVKILYREMDDPVDFFRCGIPMEYDSAGYVYTFESAGMLDIQAKQGGKPVYLNEKGNKQIHVEFPSYDDSDRFNVYYFNPDKGKWTYRGKDDISPVAGEEEGYIQDKLADIREAYRKKLSNLPKPQKADQRKYSFEIDFDRNKFPELTVYQGVKFEIDETETAFDPDLYEVVWEKAGLSHTAVKGKYTLSLTRNDSTVKLSVYPVYKQQVIDTYLAKVEALKKEREEKEKKIAEMRRQKEMAEKAARNQTEKNIASFIYYAGRSHKAIRGFNIPVLGVWNSDKPVKLPAGSKVQITFMDDLGKKIQHTSLYLIDRTKNSLFRMPDKNMLQYNAASVNIVWGVTREGKLVIAFPALLKEALQGKSTLKCKTQSMNPEKGIDKLEEFLEAPPKAAQTISSSDNYEI